MYILDGSGYIFRAFYAVQPLSTKAGFPTNALFGFTKMLIRLLRDAGETPVVAVFDAGKKNFRHDLYDQYKANRKECPPDLLEQMPHFSRIVEALGLPVLQLEGYEADDIIATLVSHFSPHTPITVVTADKDLLQLVSPAVTIWDTMKDKRFTRDEVIEKLGVPPELVPEFLALTGDASDNIPGVEGVGPKTAVQLVNIFGNTTNLLNNIEQIRTYKEIRGRDKIAAQLLESPDTLKLSRQLVELNRTVPLVGLIGECQDGPDNPILSHPLLRRNPINPDQLRKVLSEFEFSSLADDVIGAPVAKSKPQYNVSIVYKFDLPRFLDLLLSQSIVCFDLETTSLNPLEAKIVGISFAWEDQAFYLPVGHSTLSSELQVPVNEALENLRTFFASPVIKKIGQNLKYDLSVLLAHQVKVQGVYCDTMVAAYLLNSDRGSYNLTVLAKEFLGTVEVIEFEEVLAGKSSFAEVELSDAANYCGQDSVLAWNVFKKIEPLLIENHLVAPLSTLETPLISVLAKMELTGVLVDPKVLAELSSEFAKRLEEIQKSVVQQAGCEFNLNSTKQLSEILFNKLGLPTAGLKKTKTGISTDSDTLEKLAGLHPLPKELLEYRALYKLKSTYIDTLPQQISPITGRIHTRYNQTGTSTGRLSSSDPNLQNIPIQTENGRRIREAFIAPPGFVLLSADYSQIELRILAHLSKDSNLIAAFNEGRDIHASTAREILGLSEKHPVTSEERRMGKVINFGIIYGMGPHRLSRELGIPYKVAENYIENYFARYSGVRKFFDEVERSAKEKGEVRTLLGRRRVVSEILSDGRDSGFLLRAALNAPLQGTAADIIKLAMIKIYDSLPLISTQSRMLMQIHDELVFEVPSDEVSAVRPQIIDWMQNVITLEVPLVVEAGIGHNWNEAHS